MRFLVRKVISVVFLANFFLAALAFVTMDMDLTSGGARDFLDGVIDTYEAVGFGSMAAGVGVVSAVLLGLWLAAGRLGFFRRLRRSS